MKNLVILLFIFSGIFLTAQTQDMKSNIHLSLNAAKEKNYINGIIPVQITIKNNTRQEVSLLLSYPAYEAIDFESDFSGLKKKENCPFTNQRMIPLQIAAGQTYQAVYFLNRYFDFVSTGNAKISYHIRTYLFADSESESASYQGTFSLPLSEGDTSDLKEQFAFFSQNLLSSNKQTALEASEALSYLNNPLSVEYIIPMLIMPEFEGKGIKALSNFPTDRVKEVILQKLSSNESGIVSAAIQSLHKINVSIPREKLIAMLYSKNESIQYLGIENLELTPDSSDQKYIKVLMNSKNPAIAEKAKQYYSALEGK